MDRGAFGRNERGRSSGKGAAGKWVDAASSEHGDLLDVIRESLGLVEFAEIAEEARRFLSLPQEAPAAPDHPSRHIAGPVSYTHLRAHATVLALVCRLLLEKNND